MHMQMTLASPILDIDARTATRRKGVKDKGPEAWLVLRDPMGIESVGQLLHHYPRAYIDREEADRISQLRIGESATVIATVEKVEKRQMKRRGNQVLVAVTLRDPWGNHLSLPFFNQPWLATTYRVGMELAVSGVVKKYGKLTQLAAPEVEILRSDDQDRVHTRRITPVHRTSEGISTRTIRALVWTALERLEGMPDPLPREIVRAEGLSDWDTALRKIHFPDDDTELMNARERLKFDELFMLELGVGYRKQRLASERKGVQHEPVGDLTGRMMASIPFEPTKAQLKAMEQIGGAMAAPSPMNVLLQGDVGSGKTLVALHACLVAIQSGHQAAIMAPTEVLAGQHLRSVAQLLDAMGAARYTGDNPGASRATERGGQPSLFSSGAAPPLTYALLTGAVTGKDREKVLEGVVSGAVDLVIGTHALVQEGVAFRDLSLAVVDEQHRFGLHQRMALKDKGGGDIDVLIMTATPIPRTLALTYYGDLDVVVLDEMPAGRRPIATKAARTPAQRHPPPGPPPPPNPSPARGPPAAKRS